ncbi:MAG: redoxin domain-containing protein [Chitinophagaceae bacterium]
MKKNIQIVILIILFLAAAFIGWRCYKVLKMKKEIGVIIHNLPKLNFQYFKKGDEIDDKPVIVSQFSPDCEHCQYMAEQINLNQVAFKDCPVIMITGATKERTEEFIKTYKLSELPFLSVGIDTSDYFYRTFGTNSIPSFFIYNREHKLIKTIKGETKIDNLTMAINRY